MEWLNKIMQTKAGKIGIGITLAGAIVVITFQLMSMFGSSAVASTANTRIFICSETLKSFQVNLEDLDGKPIPIMSPYSKKETGYPAELCYWTADGKVKSQPTPVLLNSAIGKTEPTFCPDCGRLVIGHNPMAQEGGRVPPTKAEWENRFKKQ